MGEIVESSEAGLGEDGDHSVPDNSRGEPASQELESPDQAGFERQLGEMIEKEVNRRFQSAKDKRWAQLEKQYRELGELREMAEALLAVNQESTDMSGEQDGNLEARIRSLAELPGLKGNHPARALILRHMAVEDVSSYARVMEELLHLTLGKPKDGGIQGSTSAAVAVIPGGSDAPSDLAEAYRRRKRQLRPGDINALTALKREFRQKGLDVF